VSSKEFDINLKRANECKQIRAAHKKGKRIECFLLDGGERWYPATHLRRSDFQWNTYNYRIAADANVEQRA
jgi:hypothetical protein